MSKTKSHAGRPADEKRKAQTLDAVADWVLEHGLAAMTLRKLAAALDTSPRMLLYDFTSKDELVRDALIHIQSRQAQKVGGQLTRGTSPAQALWQYWQWLTRPEQAGRARLIMEIRSKAMNGQLSPELERQWREPWAAMFARFGAAPQDVVLVRSVLFGLLIEHQLGDKQIANAAMKKFLDAMK